MNARIRIGIDELRRSWSWILVLPFFAGLTMIMLYANQGTVYSYTLEDGTVLTSNSRNIETLRGLHVVDKFEDGFYFTGQ